MQTTLTAASPKSVSVTLSRAPRYFNLPTQNCLCGSGSWSTPIRAIRKLRTALLLRKPPFSKQAATVSGVNGRVT